MTCNICGQPIEKFEDFPGGICLTCHEKQFNQNQELNKLTGEALAKQFTNLSNIS